MQSLPPTFLLKLLLDSLATHNKPPTYEQNFLQSQPLNFPSFPHIPSQLPPSSNIYKMNEILKAALSKTFDSSHLEPPKHSLTDITASVLPSKDLGPNIPGFQGFQLYMRNLYEKTRNTSIIPKQEANVDTMLEPKIKMEENEINAVKIEDEEVIIGRSNMNVIKMNVNRSDALEYIQNILAFLVKNVGRIRGTKLKAEGDKLHKNIESIKEIYEGLMNKFMISNKTKEEKIKYVLRKSFKFMKEKLMLLNGMSLDSENDSTLKKQIEIMFFDHYFANSQESLTNRDFSDIKDMIMPFRKNSQNKTMNNEFLKKIFSFEKFYSDYALFLKNFKEIAEKDNKEKLIKTSKKIADLMASRQYKEFSQKYFKRMPWLEVWIEEAENIAKRLIDSIPKKDLKFLGEEEPKICKKQFIEKTMSSEPSVIDKKVRAYSI